MLSPEQVRRRMAAEFTRAASKKGWKFAELAARCGLGDRSVRRILKGTQLPGVPKLLEMCALLGVDPERLFGRVRRRSA